MPYTFFPPFISVLIVQFRRYRRYHKIANESNEGSDRNPAFRDKDYITGGCCACCVADDEDRCCCCRCACCDPKGLSSSYFMGDEELRLQDASRDLSSSSCCCRGCADEDDRELSSVRLSPELEETPSNPNQLGAPRPIPEATQPVQPAQPVQEAQPVQSAQPAGTTQVVQPVHFMQPVCVVQPVQPIRSVQLVQPAQSVQPDQTQLAAGQMQQPQLAQEVRDVETAARDVEMRSSSVSFNGMRLIEAVADDGSGRTVYIAIPYICLFTKRVYSCCTLCSCPIIPLEKPKQ